MKARVYINRHVVAANKKNNQDKPSISINTYKDVTYCKKIEFTKGCTLIQDKDNAICSGATIWMEAEFEDLVFE